MNKKDSKIISKLIITLPVISVLLSILLLSIGTVYIVNKTYKKELAQTEINFIDNLKTTTKKRIDITYKIVEGLYKNGEDRNKTINLIKSVMDKLKWPDNGYVFIFDSKGNTVYHVNHKFIGHNRWNVQRNGIKIVRLIIKESLNHPNGVFVKYPAYFPGDRSMEKISYIKYYKPLDLIIGTGIYLNYLDKNLLQKKLKQKELLHKILKIIFIISFIATIITLIIMHFFSRWVNKIFKEYDKALRIEKKKLFYKANFDNLTGLCNRECFMHKLKDVYYEAKRNKKRFALLFIDIDYFKQINDTDGHKTGDRVLKIIARRLKESVRKSDLVSRFGGDEFLILFKDVKNIEEIALNTTRILDNLKKEITIDNKNYYVSGSIGISIYPDNGEDLEKLIIYADIAMYKSKEEGKDRYNFYSLEFTKTTNELINFKREILNALNSNELEVYFQPQFDKFGYLHGSEVLIRWNHPQKGLLLPDQFIAKAIKAGLIDKIDLQVFQKAVKQYKKWYDSGLNPGVLSWNVTMYQLEKDEFIDEIKNVINAYNINTEVLNLEITEESIMSNPEKSIEKLNKIKEMGISISVDDFGTGYSSLAYLKKLPLDKIKIDQSFISDIPYNRDDVIITKAIINLGKNLELMIVAEGVKTNIQRQFVIDKGCDFIQGEFYSMPVKAEEFEKNFLRND